MNVAATCDLYITAKTAKCRQNTLDGYISAIRHVSRSENHGRGRPRMVVKP
ncbi:Uncharacterised protein [Collinsella intestinalis]|uniref:Uncharacterized protein n=1 Tax=Collinsella intestinalis TaxID=147207 RepID=A0A5K1ITB3_9ACTN|nr:Uncharacterised protein [Collinsella intestinalis]